ncbi:MAG: helix-turn-helix transcriptional regulator [Bacteroidota bacterium]
MRNKLQDQLLEAVLSRYPKRSVAVEALSEMLGTGKDAVYRRLRGDTLLTPDEMQLLAQQFNISLDALVFDQSDKVFFSYSFFERPVDNFRTFLDGIFRYFAQATQQKNARVYYASAEIPFFYYCFFPELIAFKLYVWGRAVWGFDYLRNRPFDFEILPYSDLQLAEQCLLHYRELPSTEHWSMNMVDFTLSQIEYHVISGAFKQVEDALLLCDRLLELTQHLQVMAEHGRKFMIHRPPETAPENTFELFHNEMVYSNNTILVASDQGKMLFTTYGNPNFLRSTDQKICDHTQDWFVQMGSKSECISQQSEKTRAWFFNVLKRRIEQARSRISLQV